MTNGRRHNSWHDPWEQRERATRGNFSSVTRLEVGVVYCTTLNLSKGSIHTVLARRPADMSTVRSPLRVISSGSLDQIRQLTVEAERHFLAQERVIEECHCREERYKTRAEALEAQIEHLQRDLREARAMLEGQAHQIMTPSGVRGASRQRLRELENALREREIECDQRIEQVSQRDLQIETYQHTIADLMEVCATIPGRPCVILTIATCISASCTRMNVRSVLQTGLTLSLLTTRMARITSKTTSAR